MQKAVVRMCEEGVALSRMDPEHTYSIELSEPVAIMRAEKDIARRGRVERDFS